MAWSTRTARRAETVRRSFVKACTYRALSSLITYFITLAVTGNRKIASGVALFDVLAKIVGYFVHERLWIWADGRMNRHASSAKVSAPSAAEMLRPAAPHAHETRS